MSTQLAIFNHGTGLFFENFMIEISITVKHGIHVNESRPEQDKVKGCPRNRNQKD